MTRRASALLLLIIIELISRDGTDIWPSSMNLKGSTRTTHTERDRYRLEAIKVQLQVYFMENAAWPLDLETLVTEEYLRRVPHMHSGTLHYDPVTGNLTLRLLTPTRNPSPLIPAEAGISLNTVRFFALIGSFASIYLLFRIQIQSGL